MCRLVWSVAEKAGESKSFDVGAEAAAALPPLPPPAVDEAADAPSVDASPSSPPFRCRPAALAPPPGPPLSSPVTTADTAAP